ncbi:DMT family transporter [bacterium]|nr:DMT family transporter [bacterium]
MRTLILTTLAMLAFAGNSLICRLALSSGSIDPGSFTAIRIISGAAMLALILYVHRMKVEGNSLSALPLVIYAVCFSFAYLQLTAATGALLLFAAVQVTMITHGLLHGERLRGQRLLGFLLAAAGMIYLLLPGLSQPPLLSSLLMLTAGIAWGVYSLRGRGVANPLAATAGSFIYVAFPAFVWLLLQDFATPGHGSASISIQGFGWAVLSGALASGIGYLLWYAALRSLASVTAAAVQLSVPPIAALGGVLLLGEVLTARLAISSAVILGGIALVVVQRKAAAGSGGDGGPLEDIGARV